MWRRSASARHAETITKTLRRWKKNSVTTHDSAVAAATFPAGAKYYDAAYAGGSAQVALSGALSTARYYRNLSAPYGWAAVDDATAAQGASPLLHPLRSCRLRRGL